MKIKDFLAFFSDETTLPIEINAVKEKAVALGQKDEFFFVGVKLQQEILKGMFHSYSYTNGVYGDRIDAVNIFYNENEEYEWQRLICCKEILHSMDSEESKSQTQEQVRNLIANMSADKAPEFEIQSFTDHLMVFYAMAILIPFELRERMMPDYESGKINNEIIGRWAKVPPLVSSYVMSKSWKNLYEILNS